MGQRMISLITTTTCLYIAARAGGRSVFWDSRIGKIEIGRSAKKIQQDRIKDHQSEREEYSAAGQRRGEKCSRRWERHIWNLKEDPRTAISGNTEMEKASRF